MRFEMVEMNVAAGTFWIRYVLFLVVLLFLFLVLFHILALFSASFRSDSLFFRGQKQSFFFICIAEQVEVDRIA